MARETPLRANQNVSSNWFSYSIPVYRLSTSVVIAVTTNSVVSQPILDLFDMTVVLLPDHSSRIVDGSFSSEHATDYYANPLTYAIDLNRNSYWRIRGSSAVFNFTPMNGHFEFCNSYSIIGTNKDSYLPTSWEVFGCISHGSSYSCELIDQRSKGVWLGSGHSRRFSLNSMGRSYQRYSIRFCTFRSLFFIRWRYG